MAAFYSTWLNYSTLKDFAWADKYNPAAAPNRKVSAAQAAPACRVIGCLCCNIVQLCMLHLPAVSNPALLGIAADIVS